MNTVYPENPLPKYLWMKNIAKKEIDLSLIDTKTLMGFCIVHAYQIDPDKTLREIAEQIKDNLKLIESVIGTKNLQIII